MPHKMLAKEVTADVAVVTSGGLTAYSWLNGLDLILQIIATCVAITAGLYAIKWHRARLEELKRTLNQRDKVSKGIDKYLPEYRKDGEYKKDE